jgi:GGDEF domain-containing protein
MLDLDRFKEVNDTLGHEGGDQALQRVAQAILQAIRKADIAARYGGEEFAILLPDTDTCGAYVETERIRAPSVRSFLLTTPLGECGHGHVPVVRYAHQRRSHAPGESSALVAKTSSKNRTASFTTVIQQQHAA